MLRTLTLGAMVAAAAVAVAPAHADPQCITVDAKPIACADYVVELDADLSNGATVAPTIGIRVCVTGNNAGRLLCDLAPISFGATGVWLNGTHTGTSTVDGQHVHVPQVCRNSNPCVGPYDYDVPPQTIPCADPGSPEIVVNGRNPLDVFDPGVGVQFNC